MDPTNRRRGVRKDPSELARRVSVSLPAWLDDRLTAIATEDKTSFSAAVQELLKRGVAERDVRRQLERVA